MPTRFLHGCALLLGLALAPILSAPAWAQAPVYLMQWASLGNGIGEFTYPFGVATDAAGNVYVADFGNNRIQKFTAAGVYLTQWGSDGTGDGQFRGPASMARDAAGNIYVADSNNHRIQKFGDVSTPTRATSWGRIKRLYR